MPDLALGKGGLCRVPETGHSAKKINKKLKKFKKSFAECLTATTRQSLTVVAAITSVSLCRVFSFAESLTLGKGRLCRVLSFAECLALGKEGYVECLALPSAALGKVYLC